MQGIIDKKARRLPKYRKKADKLWLLILSGPDGLHSTVYFDKDVLSHKYSTDFDRIFLFRTLNSKESNFCCREPLPGTPGPVVRGNVIFHRTLFAVMSALTTDLLFAKPT